MVKPSIDMMSFIVDDNFLPPFNSFTERDENNFPKPIKEVLITPCLKCSLVTFNQLELPPREMDPWGWGPHFS